MTGRYQPPKIYRVPAGWLGGPAGWAGVLPGDALGKSTVYQRHQTSATSAD